MIAEEGIRRSIGCESNMDKCVVIFRMKVTSTTSVL